MSFEMLVGVGIYLLGVASGVVSTLFLLWALDKSYEIGHRDAK